MNMGIGIPHTARFAGDPRPFPLRVLRERCVLLTISPLNLSPFLRALVRPTRRALEALTERGNWYRVRIILEGSMVPTEVKSWPNHWYPMNCGRCFGHCCRLPNHAASAIPAASRLTTAKL